MQKIVIIFPFCTTIMFSLKLIFALFMVCLLHFYVFMTNSAPDLCQLSNTLSRYSDTSFIFKNFILLQKASSELLTCSAQALCSLCAKHTPMPWICLPCQSKDALVYFPVSQKMPFFLFFFIILKELQLRRLSKSVCTGGQLIKTIYSQSLH